MSALQFSSKMLQDFKELDFWRKVLLAQRHLFEYFSWKDKLCSFCDLPTWWKSTQTPLLIKDERFLKHWKFKNLKRQILLFLWVSCLVKIYWNISFDKSNSFQKLWNLKGLKGKLFLILQVVRFLKNTQRLLLTEGNVSASRKMTTMFKPCSSN